MIKGIQKTSFVDFEPHTVTTVFTGGCNFRCPFCHNPTLVRSFENLPAIPDEEVVDFLVSRKKWLDGICITGGEPLIYSKELPAFIKKVKEKMGNKFLVKLDTNGANPELLKELIDKKLVDYVAMDYKAPLKKYDKAAGVKVDVMKITKSVNVLFNSKVDYEFRATILPKLHSKEDVVQMAKELSGGKVFYLQKFQSNVPLLDKSFEGLPCFSEEELKELAVACSKFLPTKVRNV